MVSLRLIVFALSSTDSLINFVCIFLLAETRSRPPFRVYFSDFAQKTLCRSNLPFPAARETAWRRVNFYGTLFCTVHFRAISAGLWITDRNIIRGTISELRACFADAYSRFRAKRFQPGRSFSRSRRAAVRARKWIFALSLFLSLSLASRRVSGLVATFHNAFRPSLVNKPYQMQVMKAGSIARAVHLACE